MLNYRNTVINNAGQPVSGVSVNVYLAGTTTNATIYSDDGVTTTANPVTTDSNGRFAFYVADGKYDLKFSGAGVTTYTLQNIEIFDITGATNSGDANWRIYTLQAVEGLSVGSSTPTSTAGIYIAGTPTVGTTQYGVDNTITFGSDGTVAAYGYFSAIATANAAYTVANAYHVAVQNITKQGSSVVTNQYGFYVGTPFNAGGTSNYAFYNASTAFSYLGGSLGIGSGKTSPSFALDVAGQIRCNGVIQARVTNAVSANSVTLVPANGDVQEISLTANVTTLSFGTGTDGQIINVIWVQDATGGRTVTYPSSIKGGGAPSTTANSISTQCFVYRSSNSTWYSLGAIQTGM